MFTFFSVMKALVFYEFPLHMCLNVFSQGKKGDHAEYEQEVMTSAPR